MAWPRPDEARRSTRDETAASDGKHTPRHARAAARSSTVLDQVCLQCRRCRQLLRQQPRPSRGLCNSSLLQSSLPATAAADGGPRPHNHRASAADERQRQLCRMVTPPAVQQAYLLITVFTFVWTTCRPNCIHLIHTVL